MSMNGRAPLAVTRQDADATCRDCEPSGVPDACVRVSEADRGYCQREARYRRDMRKRNQRMTLTARDVDLIENSKFLSCIGPVDLQALVNSGKVRPLYRGERLFHQGDPSGAVFFVLDGCLKEFRNNQDGVVTVREILESGDFIGEADVVIANPYSGSVEAVWDSRLLELPSDSFMSTFTSCPPLAQILAKHFSHRLHRQSHELEEAYWLSASQRLANYLGKFFPEDGRNCDGRLPFDKNVLAARLGMSPETLSRAFISLKKIGVKTHIRCIYVESVHKLREYSQSDGHHSE